MDDVRTYVASYDFLLWKDWWGFNKMSLCSPVDLYIQNFAIFMYVIFSFTFYMSSSILPSQTRKL